MNSDQILSEENGIYDTSLSSVYWATSNGCSDDVLLNKMPDAENS